MSNTPKFRTDDIVVVKKLSKENVELLDLKSSYKILGYNLINDDWVYSMVSPEKDIKFVSEYMLKKKLEIPPMEFKYVDSCDDEMIVLSNFNDITTPYMESKGMGSEAICISMNKESFGLSIKNAEDLIDKLQKIVKFHYEFYDRKRK